MPKIPAKTTSVSVPLKAVLKSVLQEDILLMNKSSSNPHLVLPQAALALTLSTAPTIPTEICPCLRLKPRSVLKLETSLPTISIWTATWASRPTS